MKTIDERARDAAWQIFEETILSEHSVERVAEIIAEKMHEQKAVDIENACQWITEHIDIPYEVETIDGEPVASDYIEWCQKKRLEAAKEITDDFRQAMKQ